MRAIHVKVILLAAVGSFLLMLPWTNLRALGLGEAQVDSYIGQVLDLRIRLVEPAPDALESLTVSLASPRDHERLGVPMEALAYGLDVSVDRRVDPPVLRVRSRRPVSEPVLQFLVDARWSGGRILREYTVFLDPPTIAVAPPVTAASAARPAPEFERTTPVERAPEPRAAPTRPVAPPAARPEPAPAAPPGTDPVPVAEPRPAPTAPVSGQTITVAAGQTLWSIASDWRPDPSLTMAQVMMTILEQNPAAFADGNVNRLMRGAELVMPDIDSVTGMDADQAQRMLAAQMRDWQTATAARDVPVISEAAVAERDWAAERVPEPEPEPISVPEPFPVGESETVATTPRLAVVPAEDEFSDGGALVSDSEVQAAAQRLDALERSFAEELSADPSLYVEVDGIRALIEQRDLAGLAVADEDLASLEARLRERRQREEESAWVFDDDDSAMFEEIAGASEVVQAPAVPEPAAPPVVPVAPTSQGGQGPLGLPLWAWAAAALLLVLLVVAVVFVILRRRSSVDEPAVRVGPKFGPEDQLAELREQLASSPSDLVLHLAVLKLLSDRSDEDGFAEALDDMSVAVTDESAPEWKEALSLAADTVPSHPLLMPSETVLHESGEAAVASLGEVDESNVAADEPVAEETLLADDSDLAELSGRLDERVAVEPSLDDPSGVDSSDDGIDFQDDLAAFDDEPLATDTAPDGKADVLDFESESADEAQPDTSVIGDDARARPDDDEQDDLDLDFSFSSQLDTDTEEPVVGTDTLVTDEEQLDTTDDHLGASAATGDRAAADGSDVGDSGLTDGDGSLSDDDAEVKLDLARAYLAMEDPESARALLEEIDAGASAALRAEARRMLDEL